MPHLPALFNRLLKKSWYLKVSVMKLIRMNPANRKATEVRLSCGGFVTAYITGIGAWVLFTPRGPDREMGSPSSIFGGLEGTWGREDWGFSLGEALCRVTMLPSVKVGLRELWEDFGGDKLCLYLWKVYTSLPAHVPSHFLTSGSCSFLSTEASSGKWNQISAQTMGSKSTSSAEVIAFDVNEQVLCRREEAGVRTCTSVARKV